MLSIVYSHSFEQNGDGLYIGLGLAVKITKNCNNNKK